MIIEKSKDFFDAYSDNCDGIYAAGESVDAVKADTDLTWKTYKDFDFRTLAAEELGYTIGGFGSQGERETWVFKDEVSGEKKFTHGTPASMPMYKAFENAIDNMERIVREIFK